MSTRLRYRRCVVEDRSRQAEFKANRRVNDGIKGMQKAIDAFASHTKQREKYLRRPSIMWIRARPRLLVWVCKLARLSAMASSFDLCAAIVEELFS
jgi:hypothetical protein